MTVKFAVHWFKDLCKDTEFFGDKVECHLSVSFHVSVT